MNLFMRLTMVSHIGYTVNTRSCSLCEDLFAQMTCASAFDAIEEIVYS